MNYTYFKQTGYTLNFNRLKTLIQLTFFISICFFISSCDYNKVGTQENLIDSTKIGKIKTVLILGNSIVRHGPSPDIGWYGDWGMAATAMDSDFVHILIRNIKQKDIAVVIKFINIAEFEKNFVSYPLSSLESLRNPGLIVLRISENVDEKKAADSNFIAYYDKLLNYLDPDKKSVKIIVDGFWDKPVVNGNIKQYAIDNNYAFITTTDLSKDTTNQAGKAFENFGVAMHPSDKGMRMIAERIWAYMKFYF